MIVAIYDHRVPPKPESTPEPARKPMSVTAVVVNYNTRALLARCLESIARWEEVVVVDNASTDGSASMVAERFPQVKVVRNRRNVGFGAGANAGVAQASGEIALVLNPDTWVSATAKRVLEEFFEIHPDAGIAGCGLLDAEGRVLVSARRFYTLQTMLARRIAPGSARVREFEAVEAGYQSPRQADWVTGTGMAIRRRAFEEIGGFDDRFFLYFEDVDICARAWLAGWEVWYVPNARVFHEEQRASARSPVALGRHLRSWALFSRKWKSLSKPAFAAPAVESVPESKPDGPRMNIAITASGSPISQAPSIDANEHRSSQTTCSPQPYPSTNNRPIRAVIEARCLLGHLTGVGRSLESLLTQMAGRDEIEVVLLATSARRTREIHKYRFYAKTRAVRVSARMIDVLWNTTGIVPIEALAGRSDVVHGPNFVIPSSLSAARVLTVHDLGFVRHPELHSPSQIKLARTARSAVAKAHRIIAVSEFTKAEICSVFDIDPAKIDVIYHGVRSLPDDGPSLPDSFPKEFILFAGTFELRKGAAVLLSAYRIAREKEPSIPPLVIAGDIGLGGADALERAFSAGLDLASVKLVRSAPDTQLAHLYRNASLFVFPSLYEGFGMPPLEAMAHGVPTVATALSSLPEILGDGALLVESPTDTHCGQELAEAVAQAVLNVLYDEELRKSLSERGRARASRFSWARAADMVIATYKRAIAESR